MNEQKNIVIVGGGTAGWLTALSMKKSFPNENIILVESEELGILGAGEGTTPGVIGLLDWLNIPVSEFVKKTGATIKNGNKFTNWSNDNSYFFHNFGSLNNIGGDSWNTFSNNFDHSNIFYHTATVKKEKTSELDFAALLCEQNKAPHILKEVFEQNTNPINNFYSLAPFAIHFDAIRVANFLKEESIKRGIIRKEGKVIRFNNAENGNIISLVLENKNIIDVDFIFDCSGFYKIINGKHYKTKWTFVDDKLSVNSAIPFFLPPVEYNKIPPYTEATAMKYGWSWKIPLQHRFGCGYVYDNNYINREDAKKEIINYLGFEPEWGKHFSFRSGYTKTPWIKNCIALGVSSAFLEPLEATSIWTTTLMLEMICSDPAQLFINDERINNDFNCRFETWMKEIIDFIYFHYMGYRTDTEFWKKFQDIKNAPETLQKIIEKWEFSLPRYLDYQNINTARAFSNLSWFEVSYGLKRINYERIKKSFKNNNWDKLTLEYQNTKNIQKEMVNNAINHGEMLKILTSY